MMETKKNPKHDLERKSFLFLNIGLIVSLSITVTAFEWKFYRDSNQKLIDITEPFIDLTDIPLTDHVPPPPPVQLPAVIPLSDDIEIEKQVDIEIDTEITAETIVKDLLYLPPVPDEIPDEIELFPEVKAEPVGGMKEFYKFLAENIKYPSPAIRMGVEGRVYVQFVVDKDGTLTDIQAVKGIGAGCDEEAVRVVGKAPKWKPGKQRGNPVKTRMMIPITFKN